MVMPPREIPHAEQGGKVELMKCPKAQPGLQSSPAFLEDEWSDTSLPLGHGKGTEDSGQVSSLTPSCSSSVDVSLLFQHFFEGVKARIAQGVKEEEVSFQLAYSKQELRKVIERYPGKEVKKALETLYRKIHKYLSPEENLLPVIDCGVIWVWCHDFGGSSGLQNNGSSPPEVPSFWLVLS